MLRKCFHRFQTATGFPSVFYNALRSVSQSAQTETAVEDRTFIQRVAPRTKAAQTWTYQAWPLNKRQGDETPVTFPLLNFERQQVGSVELGGDIFNIPVRRDILHRVVRWQRAKKQQGTHKAKNRAEVSGGGRKPWKQKGTGRARQGSIRAPQWRGGGKAHGPVPRSHAHGLNKKVRRLGLKCALSAKAVENRLMIVDAIRVEELKTKIFHATLLNLLEGAPRISVLMMDSEREAENGRLARRVSRNIPNIKLFPVVGANVYDILKYDILIMTKEAVEDITQFLRSVIKR